MPHGYSSEHSSHMNDTISLRRPLQRTAPAPVREHADSCLHSSEETEKAQRPTQAPLAQRAGAGDACPPKPAGCHLSHACRHEKAAPKPGISPVALVIFVTNRAERTTRVTTRPPFALYEAFSAETSTKRLCSMSFSMFFLFDAERARHFRRRHSTRFPRVLRCSFAAKPPCRCRRKLEQLRRIEKGQAKPVWPRAAGKHVSRSSAPSAA